MIESATAHERALMDATDAPTTGSTAASMNGHGWQGMIRLAMKGLRCRLGETLASNMRSSTDPLLKCADITDQILGAFYRVYNRFGPGLAERIYERALVDELRRRGCDVPAQQGLSMRYGQVKVWRFRADLLVEGEVLVEIKARSRILKGHWAQLLHYLAVTGNEVGLLLDFGPQPRFKRLVL